MLQQELVQLISFTNAMITSLKASSVQTAARSHNQTDERAHMPIFPINQGTELCCEKRMGYYISPSKTSSGRQSGAQTQPVSPAQIWISLGSVTHCGDVNHTRYWLEERAFFCPSVRIHTRTHTHTHTHAQARTHACTRTRTRTRTHTYTYIHTLCELRYISMLWCRGL